MVGAADDVGDAEVEVVSHSCELVRRGPIGAQQRHPAEAERPVGITRGRAAALRGVGRRVVDGSTFALADGALLPRDPEPVQILEDHGLAALDGARSVGVVDAENE